MPGPVRQAAAIPLRGDGLICMVTSRSGKRWVLPKGRNETGYTPEETALAEAWEEAGLTGSIEGGPIGTYKYEKYGRDHAVTVFLMRVTRETDDWPEADWRTREWVTVEEALVRIEEPGLRRIVRELARTRLAVTVES